MIDLHTHTTASDGRTSPENLLFEAAQAGVTVLGLTDHDTTSAWESVSACVPASGVALVRGIEISAKAEDVPVHILGYLFNPDDARIRAHCERLRVEREGRAREIVKRIGRDVPLTWDDVELRVEDSSRASASLSPSMTQAQRKERFSSSKKAVIGRPHIADARIANGVVRDRQEAFDRFLLPGSPYYVPHYAPQALEALKWINEAGGKVVFAHPNAPQRGKVPSRAYLREMAQAGMFGIEVDHRDNQNREELVVLARECGLVTTGASDYHGTGKPNRLGENTTSREVLERLADQTFLEVVEP